MILEKFFLQTLPTPRNAINYFILLYKSFSSISQFEITSPKILLSFVLLIQVQLELFLYLISNNSCCKKRDRSVLCEKFGVNKSKISVHIKRMFHGPQFGLQIILQLYESSPYNNRVFWLALINVTQWVET